VHPHTPDTAVDLHAVLADVARVTGTPWTLAEQFGRGRQGGAWRVGASGRSAVLKAWSPGDGVVRNPDARRLVEQLRSVRYPTPAWLAGGQSPAGSAWVLIDFVEGDSLPELDVGCAPLFVELVERQRGVVPDTRFDWNARLRSALSPDGVEVSRLVGGGPELRALVDEAMVLGSTRLDAPLGWEMVHGDLNVQNVLVNDGRVAGVVDTDALGGGCAVIDLLSPVVNAVSWASDPVAIAALVEHALLTYGIETVALVAAGLVMQNAAWYQRSDPGGIEMRAARYRGWLAGLDR
jgi:hypothetical protein